MRLSFAACSVRQYPAFRRLAIIAKWPVAASHARPRSDIRYRWANKPQQTKAVL